MHGSALLAGAPQQGTALAGAPPAGAAAGSDARAAAAFGGTAAASDEAAAAVAGLLVVCGGRLGGDEVAKDCWLLTLSRAPPRSCVDAYPATPSGGGGCVWRGAWARLCDLPSPRCGMVAGFLPAAENGGAAGDGGGKESDQQDPQGQAGTDSGCGSVVVFGGVDPALGFPHGVFALRVLGADRSSSKVTVAGAWASQTLGPGGPRLGRLGHAAAVLRGSSGGGGGGERSDGGNGGGGPALLVFGGVTAEEDLADVVALTPPV